MGHVVNRHSQRRVQKVAIVNWFLWAMHYILSAMLDLDYELQKSLAEWLGSMAFYGEQGFSRRDEYQADAFAWDLLKNDKNDYTPKSLDSFFEKLDWLEKRLIAADVDNQDTALLTAWGSTHPKTSDRIERFRSKWRGLSGFERMRLSQNKI